MLPDCDLVEVYVDTGSQVYEAAFKIMIDKRRLPSGC